MAENMMKIFVIVIIIQLFYSFAITTTTYALPSDTLDYVTSFSDITTQIDLESVTTDLQDSVESSLNIPVIELGALVFYSGNILIDLLLNFAFAIPQMIALLINGFLYLFNIDSYLATIIQLFSSAIITALYFVGLIQLLMNVRSGRVI